MRFGIFIYPGVEPIDLATYGVLSMARRIAPEIEICTIAPEAGPIELANGQRPATLDYIRRVHAGGRIASVCTGAMILAASGILDGGPATTKREVVPPETAPLEVMRATYPQIEVREAQLVDSGSIVTGGGVTLCIDTTLHLLGDMLGAEVARETARILEYDRAQRANRDGFAPIVTMR
jgi:transcriptional regulator GlxA family with amidase domain